MLAAADTARPILNDINIDHEMQMSLCLVLHNLTLENNLATIISLFQFTAVQY